MGDRGRLDGGVPCRVRSNDLTMCDEGEQAMAEHPAKIGKYDIEGIIGEGGMGVVYRGRDPLIDRVVAIKTIRTDEEDDREELLQRLRMEARSAGKLQHPNIVIIHDFGEQDELAYLVMEYVEGHNLARIIKKGRHLPFDTKVDVVIQLSKGLDYAHGLGVTHRDIKPGNIAITAKGTAKILDFGLARIDSTRLTKTGFTSGTVAYMSPERMRGESGTSDDIFALGAVAYEVFTYKRAFPGTSYSEIVTKVLSSEYPLPPSSVATLPPELDPIILRALTRDPKDRYQSAGDFARELESFRHSLAYQTWVARGVERDVLEILHDDTPISSTANPYSAGAMTPTGAAAVDPATGKAQVQEEPKTEMNPRVAGEQEPKTEISPRISGEQEPKTEISPRISGEQEPKTEISPRMSGEREPRTEMTPRLADDRPPASGAPIDRTVVARPLAGDDPEAAAPTVVDQPAYRPEAGGTAVTPAYTPEGERAAGESGPVRTVVARALNRLRGRRPDDAEPTVAEPRTGGLDRTAPYAPGEAPAAARPGAASAPAPPVAEKEAAPLVTKGIEVWLPAGILLACVLAAAGTAQFGGLGAYLGFYAAGILAWIWLLRRSDLVPFKTVLAIGFVLRAGLLFIPPIIAVDAWRGLWDGQMAANGFNPYAMSPVSDEVAMARPEWFHLISDSTAASTYPPWALLMFMIVSWLGGTLFLWKLILLAIDMFTLKLLSRYKSGHGMLLYATCPLVALEGIWNGRIEIVVLAFLIAASWALRQQESEIRGGLLAGLGIGTSVFALPALPALWGTADRILRTILFTFLAAAAPFLLFKTEGRIAERLREFMFDPALSGIGLTWLTEKIADARLAESIAENAETVTWAPLANAMHSFTAENMATALVAALILLLLAYVTKKSTGPDAAVANCLGVFFLLTALFSPAGWLLLVPFAIIARQSLWLLYALVTPAAYLLPEGEGGWMILLTLYLLPPVIWLLFRGDDKQVHLFDTAGKIVEEDKVEFASWTPSRKSS
jgi:serine/threonine protein kinase